jgi:hypothetical protein
MSTTEIILFEFGLEVGGATVYKLADNRVMEKGSSGGILYEDEDPIRKWNNGYIFIRSLFMLTLKNRFRLPLISLIQMLTLLIKK